MRNWKKPGLALLVFGLCMILMVLPAQAKEKKVSKLETKAAKIVNSQIKDTMSQKQALKKLFRYVEKKYGYQRTVGFQATKGWEKAYAQEMFTTKKGSCYHFAAAFAFLAKKATNAQVRICIGTTNGFNASVWQPHAWCEIKLNGKWYVFDANLDKFAAKSSGKYFNKLRTSKQMKAVYKTSKTVKAAF